jgi:hypothetical protein
VTCEDQHAKNKIEEIPKPKLKTEQKQNKDHKQQNRVAETMTVA